jgi:hypothetical protein
MKKITKTLKDNRMKKHISTLACALMMTVAAMAQESPQRRQNEALKVSRESILKEGNMPNAFDAKKFRAGVSMNVYWSAIVGPDLPEEYFWKPSLGGTIRAEYYPVPWIGVSTGIGYQQSGAGVVNKDISGGAFAHPWIVNKFGVRGDPDSTYLEKLRFSIIEIPVMLALRTPFDVIQPGWRISGGIGPNFIRVVEVNKIFQSIVDGFHDDHYIKENYLKNDIGLMAALGMDIDSGTGQMFQVQFVYLRGTRNVYKADPGTGYQSYMGMRFTWLF